MPRSTSVKRDRRNDAHLTPMYQRDYLRRIRNCAMKQVEGAQDVLHIRPRAYCIAKPAGGCAVLITPPEDSIHALQGTDNATAEIIRIDEWHGVNVKVGEWYVVAYVCTASYSGPHIISI